MLSTQLLALLRTANPWLESAETPVFSHKAYIPRQQITELLKPIWDEYITILTGPRQAGKTTLGYYLSQQLISLDRYQTLLYLNCDELLIREWLTGSHIIKDIENLLKKDRFILFIDEVQRLENPGLFLKGLYDLHRPIKLIATGSSQLEMKSKVQEHLTGRQLESVILPLSLREWDDGGDSSLLYGCYPRVVRSTEKALVLSGLYNDYIKKDIVEILKIRNADVVQKLLGLLAHASGQLINYQQLATDCGMSSHTVQHYLSILENTYVVHALKPFVGNKRTEITSNPIYYFIDNGFRNQALNNFSLLDNRTDLGLLIQSFVFQELYKFKVQSYLSFDLFYWRTKGGAEVDFIFYKNDACFVPIEVKYRNLKQLTVSRGFRSFIEAYQPKIGIILSKDLWGEIKVDNCTVHFIPFSAMIDCVALLGHIYKEA